MPPKHLKTAALSALATVSMAGSAACAAESVRHHLWMASLGPICGSPGQAQALAHCWACTAAPLLAVLGLLVAGAAVIEHRRAWPRASRGDLDLSLIERKGGSARAWFPT